jgi:hypothetical protein
MQKGVFSENPRTIAASFSANNINMKVISSSLLNLDQIEGYISVSGNLRTQGTNPFELLQRLQSNCAVAARHVTLPNIDIDKVVTFTATEKTFKIDNIKTMVLEATSSGKTLFNNFDGYVKVNNGILSVTDLNFDTSFTKGVMAGNVGLHNFESLIDSTISFIPHIHFSPLAVSMKFSGPMNRLTKTIDTKPIEDYLKSNFYRSYQGNYQPNAE